MKRLALITLSSVLLCACQPTAVVITTPKDGSQPSRTTAPAELPSYEPGVTRPQNGGIYRYQNLCWRAKNSPGPWERPQSGSWFWDKVACTKTVTNTTPQPTTVASTIPSVIPSVMPTAIPTTTPVAGQCRGERYLFAGHYETGDVIYLNSTQYQCSVGGWCSQADDYAPNGRLSFMAWKNQGKCEEPLREDVVLAGTVQVPNNLLKETEDQIIDLSQGQIVIGRVGNQDASDLYRLTLINAATIELYSEGSRNISLTATQNGRVVAQSVALEHIKQLSLAAGSYQLVLENDQQASTYQLNTQAQAKQGLANWSVLADFEPEQALVLEQTESGRTTHRTIELHLPESAHQPSQHYTLTPEQLEKWQSLAQMRNLTKLHDQAYFEPNFYYQHFSVTPNDPYWDNHGWHYRAINLPQAWATTTGQSAEPVVVAVIDSGILPNHPDVAPLVDGYDFINWSGNSMDGDGYDNDPTDMSQHYHGPHVAGTVSAATNNALGIAGTSWNAHIMPLRAIGERGAATASVADAILYAAGLPNGTGRLPSRKADVINMSLGGPMYSRVYETVVAQARAEGVIVIAAAGNEGDTVAQYPASTKGVVSVSAFDASDDLAPYSSYGKHIDISAPGGNTRADVNNDGVPDGVTSHGKRSGQYSYTTYQGTSMAAPHVAGVAALMRAVNPNLTPVDFDQLLQQGELTRVGSQYNARFGHGRIDANRAVQAAIALASTPRIVLGNTEVDFGTRQTQAEVALSLQGGASISRITTSQPWLQVQQHANKLVLTVNRALLTEQLDFHKAQITIRDQNSRSQIIQVSALALPTFHNQSGYVGQLSLALFDAGTLEPVLVENIAYQNGGYRYHLTAPQGHYYLLVGTDLSGRNQPGGVGDLLGGYYTEQGDLGLLNLERAMQLDLTIAPH